MRHALRAILVPVFAAATATLTACREPLESPLHTPTSPASAAWGIEPSLAALLAGMPPSTSVFSVVEYDVRVATGPPLAGRIRGVGAGARALKHLPYIGVLATARQIDAVAALPGVTRVWNNRRLTYFGATASTLLLDRSVPTIKADQARAEFGVTGYGVGVVILDSGIDGLLQQDLRYPARTVQNLKVIASQQDIVCVVGLPCAPSIYVEGLPNSETSVGHGTHVAGIAGGDGTQSAGLYTGVAPGANLIGIGTGDVLFIFWAMAGFDYVLENQDRYNIKVVNNSWGTTGAFDPNDPINVATRRLYDRGVTVVFAAGNEGPGDNTLNPYSVAPWVIGVAATCSATDSVGQANVCDGGMLADFSSRGIRGDALYHPAVAAPGVYVNSTRASTGPVLTGLDAPDDLLGTCGLRTEFVAFYTCASGTSMASPHVAGVVALMQEWAGGQLTPDQVKGLLVDTAEPLANYAPFEVGAGMVNALEAVRGSR